MHPDSGRKNPLRWRLKPREKGLVASARPRSFELRQGGKTLAVVSYHSSGEWYFYTLGFKENVNSSGDWDERYQEASWAKNEAIRWVREHLRELT